MKGQGSNNRLTGFVFRSISTLMLSIIATMAPIYGAGLNMVAGLSYTWTTRWMIVTMLMVLALGEIQQKWGINYGLLGDNLPSPVDTVNLILSKPTIKMVRIFEPRFDILDALKGHGLGISVGVSHNDLSPIATNPQAAHDWVQTYIIPYSSDVIWITVGNEAIPGPFAQYILPAIKNIQQAINDVGLGGSIRVTTVVSGAVLGTSFPPSAGAFSEETFGIMSDLVKYLYTHPDFPTNLMVNVYPYFAFASDPQHIGLDYAMFNSTSPVLIDEPFVYYSLYDAMVDAFLSAIQKVLPLGTYFDVTISETGWPSAGGDYATVENAAAYNNNLKKHLLDAGTPKRPGLVKEIFIFALFNENQKPVGIEQNFGCFNPDMSPVYELW